MALRTTQLPMQWFPPFSVDIMNEWTYTPTPPICLHGLDRENFIFMLYVCYGNETIIMNIPF